MPHEANGDPETRAIIGAAMAVHRALGMGFLEAVYREALALEFRELRIPFQAEVPFRIRYRGQRLRTLYLADFVCFCGVIVEIKARPRVVPSDEAQIINYLRASECERGLLINFGASSLQFRRFAFSRSRFVLQTPGSVQSV